MYNKEGLVPPSAIQHELKKASLCRTSVEIAQDFYARNPQLAFFIDRILTLLPH